MAHGRAQGCAGGCPFYGLDGGWTQSVGFGFGFGPGAVGKGRMDGERARRSGAAVHSHARGDGMLKDYVSFHHVNSFEMPQI